MNLNRLFELAGLPNNDLLLEAAYDGMIDSLKKSYPNNVDEINQYIKKAKELFTAPNKQSPTSDKMVWYIKVLKAVLSNNINTAKGSYNFTNMETFNNDLFHYYGYNIPQIFDTELNNQNISELFQTFNTIVQNYQKSDKPPVPVVEGDYELIKCNDGTSWWFINRSYCEEEGRSGKHCGNVVGKNDTSQRILSLRTPNHNVILTFILLKNGYLGEMKAKANQKPSTKYHPNIMQLLLNPKIKGIKGAGYAPYMNFSIFDLSDNDIKILINHGKQSFIADQIKAEPIEFLKAPDYIKNVKEYQQVAIQSLPALKHLIGSEKLLGAWENAIHEEPALIIYAPPELHNFKSMVTYRLKYYPEDLLKAPKYVSQDFDILKAVIEYDNNSIQYVMPTTPRYNELCKIAVSNRAYTLEFVPETLRTLELCKIAVSQDGDTLQYVPENLRTYELCKIAVSKNGYALQYVPENLRTEELCKIVVSDNGYALEFVPEKLRTYELCKIAVSKYVRALAHVPTDLPQYEELCKQSMKNGGKLNDIKPEFRTYEVCKLAVMYNYRSFNFKFIPTTIDNYEELCRIAVKYDTEYRENSDSPMIRNGKSIVHYINDEKLRLKLMKEFNINESLDFKYFQTL